MANEYVVDPREPKAKNMLLRHVFHRNKALYDEYVKYHDEAVEAGSGIPDVQAWIKFRKHWTETSTGWRKK